MKRREFATALCFAAALCLRACRSAATSGSNTPSAPAVSADGRTIRVMTFNIAAGHGDLAKIAGVIRDSRADIVALQEVDVHWEPRSAFADQASELASATGMTVRFAPIYRIANEDKKKPMREFGVAVLSRFPVIAFRNHPIARLSTQQVNAASARMTGFLDATLDVYGTRLRVFNTHLDYRGDPAVRIQQVSEMLAIVGTDATPAILFGDLNATPTAPELAPLFARFVDAWPTNAGAGLSYPATTPTKRIDYVLLSRGLRTVSASVLQTDASDHLPVVAEVLLPGRR